MNRFSLIAIAAIAWLPTVPSTTAAADRLSTCPETRLFGEGVFSRPGYEWRLTFSPDRTLALWSVSETFFPVTGEPATIVYSNYRNGAWSAPQVAPFSGTYSDVDPAFSPDGRTLYFSSRRPLDNSSGIRADFDLWSIRHHGNGHWGTPRHLGEVNSDVDELYPSIDRHGRLYFGSNRDGGQFDVWRSRRQANGQFPPPGKLGSSVNTSVYWEFNPEISPDGNVLLFVGLNRPDGFGYGDLYGTVALGQGFWPAQNLGTCVNSALDDYHPTVLWDRGQLIWMRSSINDNSVPPNFYSLTIPWMRD